jgi:hypothetical protein
LEADLSGAGWNTGRWYGKGDQFVRFGADGAGGALPVAAAAGNDGIATTPAPMIVAEVSNDVKSRRASDACQLASRR